MIASRTPIVRLAVQVTTPPAIIVGVYLLFAGHNRPGGGFAAGLVFGAIVTLRVIAGLQRPRFAHEVLAGGVLVTALVALMPFVWGDGLLDQVVIDGTVPVLSTIKSGTALPFDIGVTIVVVGLVLALLDGLSGTTPHDDDLAPQRSAP